MAKEYNQGLACLYLLLLENNPQEQHYGLRELAVALKLSQEQDTLAPAFDRAWKYPLAGETNTLAAELELTVLSGITPNLSSYKEKINELQTQFGLSLDTSFKVPEISANLSSSRLDALILANAREPSNPITSVPISVPTPSSPKISTSTKVASGFVSAGLMLGAAAVVIAKVAAVAAALAITAALIKPIVIVAAAAALTCGLIALGTCIWKCCTSKQLESKPPSPQITDTSTAMPDRRPSSCEGAFSAAASISAPPRSRSSSSSSSSSESSNSSGPKRGPA